MAGDLTIRFVRGGVTAEISGDAAAVQSALQEIKEKGLGALAPFLGLQTEPASTSRPAATDSSSSTPVITNPAASLRFVVNKLVLPTNSRSYAADVDGSGRPENAFANIIGALNSISLNLQGIVDKDLPNQPAQRLLTVVTETAEPGSDQRATVALMEGATVNATAGVFTVNRNQPTTLLPGHIAAGRFISDEVTAAGGPIGQLLLPFASQSVSLPIQGLRIAFDIAADGSMISNGQMNGTIKHSDIQVGLVPAVAGLLNGIVQSNSPQGPQLAQILGVAGQNPAVVTTNDVLGHPLLRSLLAPDVQIWDLQGNYAPNPLHGAPDSLSFGVGFSATKASY